MVKAIMHGCNGHMGRVITDIIKNTEGIELVAGIDKYTKVPNEYPVFENIGACDVEADVIIDFSNAADELLGYCVEKQVPVVLCTTGLSEEQLAKVEESAKKVAVLKSANMSLGINLLLKILQDATKVLSPAGYPFCIPLHQPVGPRHHRASDPRQTYAERCHSFRPDEKKSDPPHLSCHHRGKDRSRRHDRQSDRTYRSVSDSAAGGSRKWRFCLHPLSAKMLASEDFLSGNFTCSTGWTFSGTVAA